MREGPSELEGCDAEPELMAREPDPVRLQQCLFPNPMFDVFDSSGRDLGDVEVLPVVTSAPHVNGDTVVTVEQDEAGTIMVKRYRLVLPGER